MLLGILLFVGFEAAASIGEESHDPHKSIPRALLWTVGVSAVFFVIMAYAISIGYGKPTVSTRGRGSTATVLDKLATQYVGTWYASIVDLVVILDATALALAICVTIGRGYFALGRDGLLPSVFAKTSRHNTPWVGNLMVVVGGVGLMLIGAYRHYGTKFIPIAGLARVRHVPGVGHRRVVRDRAGVPDAGGGGDRPAGSETTASWWQYLVVLVAIATPVLGFYGALHPAPHDTTNSTGRRCTGRWSWWCCRLSGSA